MDPCRVIVAEMVGLLHEAQCYSFVDEEQRLDYLDREARLLHRLVDVIGDERSRYLAQDAEDAAMRARSVAMTTFEDVLTELGL
jgi:hypothetical protein